MKKHPLNFRRFHFFQCIFTDFGFLIDSTPKVVSIFWSKGDKISLAKINRKVLNFENEIPWWRYVLYEYFFVVICNEVLYTYMYLLSPGCYLVGKVISD